MAFVTDAAAGSWAMVASTMATMGLDAIGVSSDPPTRRRTDLKDVIHHTDRDLSTISIRFSERLAEAGIQPSVGAVGSSYDYALPRMHQRPYKTELIKTRRSYIHRGCRAGRTARWVDWFKSIAASTSTAATSRHGRTRGCLLAPTLQTAPPAECLL